MFYIYTNKNLYKNGTIFDLKMFDIYTSKRWYKYRTIILLKMFDITKNLYKYHA